MKMILFWNRSFDKAMISTLLIGLLFTLASFEAVTAASGADGKYVLSSGWQLQDEAVVLQTGRDLSQPSFTPEKWHTATVPGTVLTSLVDDGTYPEPLYGENNRPDKIPESLCRTNYWYRTVFTVPEVYAGKKIWLNFDGINYAAEVWINGQNIGKIKGAFIRGSFDISSVVTAGKGAALAVLISPQPHPGVPHEHTVAGGIGHNGGAATMDGPTFLCTIGWDWIPAIRDRDTGIWQKVFLSSTGPWLIKEPLVTTNLSLPGLDSADIAVEAIVENVGDQPGKGELSGSFGEVSFQQDVELPPHTAKAVRFDAKTTPQLRLSKPRLWWPNGYGPQNLYHLHLSVKTAGTESDAQDVTFGVRHITYAVPDSKNLTLSVNGVPVFCRGGDWGMDEALKRVPRARLEAQIRMHQLANLNMIRNWVGQSTSKDLYELCDQYGILIWDEFFQPNPKAGPNPTDLDTYVANVRDKILRYRNHPAIAIWCARNEGFPPPAIDTALRTLTSELDPMRLYQPSSTAGKGVNSHGPYHWQPPADYYSFTEAFKTEVGSVSIPTLESIHGMLPEKDWETINDDWAEHDLAKGPSGGDVYPRMLDNRYGKAANLADFARKGQLMNYEAFRAMFEGRNAKLFHPCTGVLTWMSNPAQPSFVWQLYHYDLEPNSALFAVKKACEPVHIQLNEKEGILQVVNQIPSPVKGAIARVAIYNLDGAVASRQDYDVTAAPSSVTKFGCCSIA